MNAISQLLTARASSAGVERAFSTFGVVHSKLRLPDIPIPWEQSPNSYFCSRLKSASEMSPDFNKCPDCFGFQFLFNMFEML